MLLSAFVLRHPLVASAVFGATKLWQLYEVLQAARIHLPKEILAEINNLHLLCLIPKYLDLIFVGLVLWALLEDGCA